MNCVQEVTGVILAGGRATRMGGYDKGLIEFKHRPLFMHVFNKLMPQVGSLIISANRNVPQYQTAGVNIISDTIADYAGPLAGMLAAMHYTNREWFLFCPCDTPNIPDNLVVTLWNEKGSSPAVWVSDGEREHPTIALLHRQLITSLNEYLCSGERKVRLFLQNTGGHVVYFTGKKDNFINMNTPDDITIYENK